MSKCQIDVTKTIVKDGVEYRAFISRNVDIDFSATSYSVRRAEASNTEIELVPDSTEFLREVTDIFPLSEYDIRIVQNLYGDKIRVALRLYARDKVTGNKVYVTGPVLLSDNDYDYIRAVLVDGTPEYEWQTSEEYLRGYVVRFFGETAFYRLLGGDAYCLLRPMVLSRLNEIKTPGFVDFDEESLNAVARDTLEKALRSWSEKGEA